MKNTPLILFLASILLGCGSDGDSNEASDNALADAVIQEILDTHNDYRIDVGIANISWSEEVAISAQAWAAELASNCEFKHSIGSYGENIWVGTEGAFSPANVVNSWGSEIADYHYDSNTCADGKGCGHYTQIVWENSTKVGCGVASCDGLDIWVCQYDPPGNFNGEKPY